MAGPRCEDEYGPLAASSVSWLVPTSFSRGQAIRVGLTSTGLRATATPTQQASGIRAHRNVTPCVLDRRATTNATPIAGAWLLVRTRNENRGTNQARSTRPEEPTQAEPDSMKAILDAHTESICNGPR